MSVITKPIELKLRRGPRMVIANYISFINCSIGFRNNAFQEITSRINVRTILKIMVDTEHFMLVEKFVEVTC